MQFSLIPRTQDVFISIAQKQITKKVYYMYMHQKWFLQARHEDPKNNF